MQVDNWKARTTSAVLLLLVVSIASPQSPAPSANDAVRRFDFPQESFSISVPANWSEIDSSTLSRMPGAIRRAAPNAPEFKISHGFRLSVASGPIGYPWAAVILTGDRVSDAAFENMDRAYRTVDEFNEKWQSPAPRGTLQKAQFSNMYYDKSRHTLWGISQSTFLDVGELRTLSGAYLTKIGTVQVHCFSKALEYNNYAPLCKQIIESVIIDQSVALAK
jgi:hypothetical protein